MEVKMPLSEGQKKAYDILMSGENVFLTGEAGTGKSYVIKEFIKHKPGNVLVCAPTGVAALNIGGVTLHRAFHIPISDLRPETFIKTNSLVSSAKTIIIDEISMCRMDVFLAVASILGRARKKQIVVVGDFYQLSPVLTPRERDFFVEMWHDNIGMEYTKRDLQEPFAFLAAAWKKFHFKPICLTEQMRQREDTQFLEMLNRIRIGDMTAIPWLNQNAAKNPIKGAIFMCGRNRTVNYINNLRMDEIPLPAKTYEAKNIGGVKLSDVPAEETLTLKKGCRVMALVNDTGTGQFVNGSLGTVKELYDDYVVVDFDNGHLGVNVLPYTWEPMQYVRKTKIVYEVRKPKLDKNGKIALGDWEEVGEEFVSPAMNTLFDGQETFRMREQKTFVAEPYGQFIQLPLKVAYAVTIHKSQGQTYDSAILDPHCFGAGQLYVALSRVRSIKDLYLDSPILPGYLKTSSTVKAFYERAMNEENDFISLPSYQVTPEELWSFNQWWDGILKKRREKYHAGK